MDPPEPPEGEELPAAVWEREEDGERCNWLLDELRPAAARAAAAATAATAAAEAEVRVRSKPGCLSGCNSIGEVSPQQVTSSASPREGTSRWHRTEKRTRTCGAGGCIARLRGGEEEAAACGDAGAPLPLPPPPPAAEHPPSVDTRGEEAPGDERPLRGCAPPLACAAAACGWDASGAETFSAPLESPVSPKMTARNAVAANSWSGWVASCMRARREAKAKGKAREEEKKGARVK